MSACIIPVAPNFQDPPSPPDSQQYPYLSDFMPTEGSLNSVADPINAGTTLSANVSDQTIGITLYVRWAINYPPTPGAPPTQVLSDSTISPPPNGQPIDHQYIPKTVRCNQITSSMPPADGKYALELIVADNPLANDPTLPADQLRSADCCVSRANWWLVMNCSLPASTSGSP